MEKTKTSLRVGFAFRKTISRSYIIPLLVFFQIGTLSAQEKNPEKIEKKVNKYMQLAEAALSENNFPIAEANYRKAISLDTSNAKPLYNMGTLYYTKDKALEAADRLRNAGKTSEAKALKHKAFHNQGNAFMKQKNYQAAVEAYKNALRNDPTDDQTRYNLALAKKLLEKEQKQKQKNSPKDDKKKKEEKKGNEQKKQNQKGGGEQDKKQQKGDEQKDKKGDPNEKGKQKDKNQQQQKEAPKNSKQPQQPKPAPGQLSQQQIKNLLEAMQNQEREIQEKINARKTKGSKVNSEKDW
ncbi:MAG TPA: tetratricopeptide repeat protein [Flavobacteriaceae bacterium]|nr:tetratricopeptide repeat protein [Flavobacteriaceae bacterium]